MHCPSCRHDNRPDRRFCAECGAALALRCPSCGTTNEPGEKFCGDCGSSLTTQRPASVPAALSVPSPPKLLADKILAARAAVEGERKQVTVLFADVKGSMELAEQLDPEEWSDIMGHFFRLLADGVERFEGFVDKFTGDGIMALFGAPLAHEDHAQRACHAALYLQEHVQRYTEEMKRTRGLSFAVRMGIHTGEVVVGTIGKVGDSLRMEYTAQGHTVGLASRMEQLAGADRIYLTDHTARLVAGYFRLRDLGEFTVKGVTASLRVHELEGTGSLRTRFDIARAHGLSRFVGRASDLRTLGDALEQTAAGNGQVVGVVAEAGTGKSRLCFEFLQRCREQGMRVYEARAVAHGRNVPFLPILELLRAYFGITSDDDDLCARQKVSQHLLGLDRNLAGTLPLIHDFLAIGDPHSPGPRLDPETRQRQLIDVIRRIIRSASQKRPVVTMIEDLHWLDAASAEFLEHMVDAREGTHSLLLLNFRPEYRAAWMQKSWYRQIPLTPLGPATIAELLEDLLGSDPGIAALAAPVHARTGGNPFFTEEVVQSLIESGHLEGSRGAYRLVTAVERLEVPATVQAVLAARIDRLGEREKQLLQTAAVIGKEFSEPVLVQVLAEIAPQLADPGRLAAALRALGQAEFVYEKAMHPLAEYSFKHPLTQQVAYDTLLRERRARLHAAVAQATATVHADKLEENSALLAHHWENAGEAWQAALWSRRAAEWSGITNASESKRHWDRVRRLLRPLPHTSETVQLGATACVGSLNFAWRLGTPIAEATDCFDEGQRLAEEAGDVRAQAALHGAYGSALGLIAGLSDEYARYGREGTRLADQTDDEGLRLAQRAFLGFGCLFAGRLAEGLESAETACRTPPADPRLGVEFAGYSPFLGILLSRAWILAQLGRLNASTTACDRLEQLTREHGDLEVLTWMQLARVEVDLVRRDAAGARVHARSALESGAPATPQSLFAGQMTLGIALRLEGAWDESIAVLEGTLRMVIGGSNRMREGWVRVELARALLGRGELDRAELEASTAVAVAHKQHSRFDEASAYLVVAHTLLQRAGDMDLAGAEHAMDRAQERIGEIGAMALQPDLHECRAQLAMLRGDAPAAQCEIAEARRLYSAMGASAQANRLA
ncbi:MAG: AAA family ATPase [Candidatus Binatia bacterium]